MALSFRIHVRAVQPSRAVGGTILDRLVLSPLPASADATGSLVPDGQLLLSALGDCIGAMKPGETYTITLTKD